MNTKQLKEKIKTPFEKLPKAEQRVSIAKDVLKHIKAKRIHVSTGTFVTPTLSNPEEKYDLLEEEFNTLMKESKATCYVCALGALFIGDVFERNECNLRQAINRNERRDMYERLMKYFSRKQLGMIESAFEMTDSEVNENSARIAYIDNRKIKPSYIIKSINFGKKYAESTDRLQAIMKNIIKNEGTFKP